jgi:acetyltransferase-like isoleucine patch superfamily enzyme
VSDRPFRACSTSTEFRIADRVEFGRDVTFGPNCRRVDIGFGTELGDDIYIDVPELSIGDYVKIHRGGLVYGYQPCRIGHNCWIGQSCIIDSIGGTTIGNNVGVGAQSQLWSHIKFGDTLEGCRWNSSRELVVEDDVWFVGHCIVSPIHARRKAMLLVGGVITRDMEENHTYAGTPAKDVTDKVGPQFEERTLEQKLARFGEFCAEFVRETGIGQDRFRATVVDDLAGRESTEQETFFCLRTREYRPSRSDAEYRLMKFLLYDRAKFVPAS